MLNFEKKNLFKRVLAKTKQKLSGLLSRENFDFEDLEEYLILADLPIEFVEEVVDYSRSNFATALEAVSYVKEKLVQELNKLGRYSFADGALNVLLLSGVNGSGKTTTAAKLGFYFKQKGKKVIFAAADTFRAAGSEQLEIWAERLGLPVVSQLRGADPAAVVFDAVKSALSRQYDVVIADSAGRVHTKFNLMAELRKIVEAAKKAGGESAVVKSFLVIDANFGTNVIKQVETFAEFADIDYLIGTKLDSSSKAGSLLSASIILEKPIAFVGTGENPEDISEFEAESFVEAFFEGVYENEAS